MTINLANRYHKLYFKLKIEYRGCTIYCEVIVANCVKLSLFKEVVFNNLVREILCSNWLTFF